MNDKKMAALVLAVSMMVSGGQAAEVESAGPLRVTVERNAVQDKVFQEARMEVFTEDVQVTDDGYDLLKKALSDWNLKNRVDIMKQALDFVPDLKEAMTFMARDAAETGPLFGYSMTAEPKRADASVVSIVSRLYSYIGGAHPNTVAYTVNFDPVTGTEFTLGDIVMDYDEVYQAAVQMASEKEGLFEGYQESLEQYFYGEYRESLAWYLDDGGLVLTFSPYALAPYAAGYIDFEFPYGRYPELLKEEFLLKSE